MTNAEASTETKAATVAEQGAPVAPEKASSKKRTSQKKGAPNAKKGAQKAKAKKQAKAAGKKTSKPTTKKEASEARDGSKKAAILELLRRKDGATLAEIAKATDWQNHSIRGFISGTLVKKMGLKVESSKSEAGERTYRITK